ncbi:MAG: hypothetical protein ABSA46_12760 [Thermodesulfovibrionales bacterium]|jgi:hypothetical protein
MTGKPETITAVHHSPVLFRARTDNQTDTAIFPSLRGAIVTKQSRREMRYGD